MIDQQGEQSGSVLDGPGRSFLFCRLPAKGALTHHPQAGGGTACGSRAFSQDPEAWTIRPPHPLQDKDRIADLNRGWLSQAMRRSTPRSSVTFLPVRRNSRRHRRLVHRTKLRPMLWGLGGHRPPTSTARYIPSHCLLLLSGFTITIRVYK